MKKLISLVSALVISVVSFAGISNAADSKKSSNDSIIKSANVESEANAGSKNDTHEASMVVGKGVDDGVVVDEGSGGDSGVGSSCSSSNKSATPQVSFL